MESRKLVFRETAIVAIGEAICLGLMLTVCAMMGKFNSQIVLGGIIGTVIAILNFFFMAIGASLAADRAVQQNVKGGNTLIKSSYTIRFALIFLILFICVKSGLCNVVTIVLPLIFVRPVLTIAEFFRR